MYFVVDGKRLSTINLWNVTSAGKVKLQESSWSVVSAINCFSASGMGLSINKEET